MKITDELIMAVREDIRSGKSLRDLPVLHGVSLYMIRKIALGKVIKKKKGVPELTRVRPYRCAECGGKYNRKVNRDDKLCPWCKESVT